jgi:hypothetical protein
MSTTSLTISTAGNVANAVLANDAGSTTVTHWAFLRPNFGTSKTEIEVSVGDPAMTALCSLADAPGLRREFVGGIANHPKEMKVKMTLADTWT